VSGMHGAHASEHGSARVMSEADLVVHVALFAGDLRQRGIEIGLGDEVDATIALTLIDLIDRGEIRCALRCALKIRPRDSRTFDRLFDQCWGDAPARRLSSLRPARPVAAGPAATARTNHLVWPFGPDRPSTDTGGDVPGYSCNVLLRQKPFDQCSNPDLAAMERLLTRLMPRLATRKSRRLVPAGARGIVDVRRSLRRALATSGDLVSLAHRARRTEQPRLVVLCDTSGSMDPHVRFLLAFALSLKRVAPRTEIFAFNTSLVRLTTLLAPGNIERTLDRLAAGVPDWSGGTRIGESLADFVARYLDEFVTAKTVVAIFSDGLDRGDTALVAGAMRTIRSKARTIIWLNPLAGDPRYEPTARAMQAALPFVDKVAPAHNLESLERFLAELRLKPTSSSASLGFHFLQPPLGGG
jgi:uncharacterized protein